MLTLIYLVVPLIVEGHRQIAYEVLVTSIAFVSSDSAEVVLDPLSLMILLQSRTTHVHYYFLLFYHSIQTLVSSNQRWEPVTPPSLHSSLFLRHNCFHLMLLLYSCWSHSVVDLDCRGHIDRPLLSSVRYQIKIIKLLFLIL